MKAAIQWVPLLDELYLLRFLLPFGPFFKCLPKLFSIFSPEFTVATSRSISPVKANLLLLED